MRSLVIAQSLGEYAGGGSGGILGEFASAAQAGASWIQLSLREHGMLWIAAAVVFAVWAFRRR